MRHVYECPLRWADLDLLGHVNNVTYVDYLQEARVDMLRTHAPDARADDLAEGVVVVRHDITYAAPLTFRLRPVQIECWVSEVRAASFTMAYEVFDEHEAGERTVYLRAVTVLTPYVFADERPRRLRPEEKESLRRFLDPAEPSRPSRGDRVHRSEEGHSRVHVRFSDVDVYGHVNNVTYVEYFQEGRVRLFHALRSDFTGTSERRLVVARAAFDYKAPALFRPEPYDCWTWVESVGRTSLRMRSAICDDDTVLARAEVVAVCVDPATGRPTEPDAGLRAALEAATVGA